MNKFKLILILILISFTLNFLFAGDHKERPTEMLTAINELVEAGHLKMVPEYNEVFINKILWESIDYDQKENLAQSFTIYCGNTKNNDMYNVNVKDTKSGKKLGKYNEIVRNYDCRY